MNYIPGFSNYLQAAVPRYARGGRALFDEPVTYDVDRFEEPMMLDAEPYFGPLVDPYQYAEPVYNEPYIDPYMSAEPVYSPPYNEPVYNEPVYAEPYTNPYQYDEPVYNEPVYNPPVYNEPVYTPAVEPMTQEVAPAEVAPYVSPLEQVVQGAAPAEPQYAPAVQAVEAAPAEAAAPYDLSALAGLDLSGLNNLYGMNFASDFGGGPMGGIYQADPNLQYIGAPLSNKGNATSQTGGNTFAVRADQPVRLVDHRTNQIVFEGTGFDAARKATELGQGLTDQFGRKANYSIQTADPTGNYSTVAYEKKNKSTLGEIANVVGTVAPLALSFVPGFGQLSLLAKMGAAAGAGGLGAALKGDDILKGALLGGATAGIVGGTGLDKAIGGALGGVGGGAVQGATQGAAQGLSDEIVVTALSKLAQGAGGAAANALVSNAADAGLSEITGYKTPAEKFTPQQTPQAAQPPVDMYAGIDPIDVLASKAVPNYGGALAGVATPIATEFLPKGGLPEPLPSEPVAQEPVVQEPVVQEPAPQPIDAGVEPIVVSGDRLASGSGLPFGSAFPVPVEAILNGTLTPPAVAQQPAPEQQPVTPEPEEIVVTANKPFDPLGGLAAPIAAEFLPTGALPSQQPVTPPAPEPTVEEILVEARKPYTPPVEALAVAPAVGALTAATGGGAPNVVNGIDQATGDIVVDATPKSVLPPPPIVGVETALPTITEGALKPTQTSPTPDNKLTMKDIVDYLRLASLGVSTVGGLLGGGKGGGSGGTIPAGMGALSSLFSKQLPPATLQGGAGGGALPASTLAAQGFRSPQDYYRYGYGPEQSFFEYATQGAPNTSRAYTGYEGTAAEDRFAPQPARVAMPAIALPQPITTPIPNNPAGPSMYAPEVDNMRFARGGFAVEGAGDGRDDKIPALLSDGEYVIDAETVALLGNGSNKAGAELLDSFRVNVRKQKGKKLARGEFSDNAKRPEHYMAGGHA
jgi:hypothetical protein